MPDQEIVDPDRRRHWNRIYNTTTPQSVGWYQPLPASTLELLDMFGAPQSARIIDVGGGNSLLVDHLLENGFHDLTVLDISAVALQLARARIGDDPPVTWICSDILDLDPECTYDVWHDRAAFHFLVSASDQKAYVKVAQRAVAPGGILLIGTFADDGPEQCSGLPVTRYSEVELRKRFAPFFEQVYCQRSGHVTPSGTLQKYLFCVFLRVDHRFDNSSHHRP